VVVHVASCAKVLSIALSVECTLYLLLFFFQHGTVLCMSSQRFFHGKFDFKNGLVVNNRTFGA